MGRPWVGVGFASKKDDSTGGKRIHDGDAEEGGEQKEWVWKDDDDDDDEEEEEVRPDGASNQ